MYQGQKRRFTSTTNNNNRYNKQPAGTLTGDYKNKYYNNNDKKKFLASLIEILNDANKLNNYGKNAVNARKQLKDLGKKHRFTYYQNNGTYMTDKVPKISGSNKLARPSDYKVSLLDNKNKEIPYDLKPDRQKIKIKFTIYNQYDEKIKEFNPKGLYVGYGKFKNFVDRMNGEFNYELGGLFGDLARSFVNSNRQILPQLPQGYYGNRLSSDPLQAVLENFEENGELISVIGQQNITSLMKSIFYGGSIPRTVNGMQFFANGSVFNIISSAKVIGQMNNMHIISMMLNLYFYFSITFLGSDDTEENRLLMRATYSQFDNWFETMIEDIQERNRNGAEQPAIQDIEVPPADDIGFGENMQNVEIFNEIEMYDNNSPNSSSKLNGGSLDKQGSSDYNPTNMEYASSTTQMSNEYSNMSRVGVLNTAKSSISWESDDESDDEPPSKFFKLDTVTSFKNGTVFQSPNVFGNNMGQVIQAVSNSSNISQIPSTAGATSSMMSTDTPKNFTISPQIPFDKPGSQSKCTVGEQIKKASYRTILKPLPTQLNRQQHVNIPTNASISNKLSIVGNTRITEIYQDYVEAVNSAGTVILNKPLKEASKKEKFLLLNKLLYIYGTVFSEDKKLSIDIQLKKAFDTLNERKTAFSSLRNTFKNPYSQLLAITLYDLANSEIEGGITSESRTATKMFQMQSPNDYGNLSTVLEESNFSKNPVGRQITNNFKKTAEFGKGLNSGSKLAMSVTLPRSEEEDDSEGINFKSKKATLLDDLKRFIASNSPIEGTEMWKYLIEASKKLEKTE